MGELSYRLNSTNENHDDDFSCDDHVGDVDSHNENIMLKIIMVTVTLI